MINISKASIGENKEKLGDYARDIILKLAQENINYIYNRDAICWQCVIMKWHIQLNINHKLI